MLEKIFQFYRNKFDKEEFNEKTKSPEKQEKKVEKLLSLSDKYNEEVFVIITGINYYFGSKPFDIGKKVYLVKEPSNCYDKNAISTICDGIGKCGYVANSEKTLRPNTLSADLLYDSFSDICTATVVWVDSSYAVCVIDGINYYDLLFNHAERFYADLNIDDALTIFLKLLECRETIEVLQRVSECYTKKLMYNQAFLYVDRALLLDSENKKNACVKENS